MDWSHVAKELLYQEVLEGKIKAGKEEECVVDKISYILSSLDG